MLSAKLTLARSNNEGNTSMTSKHRMCVNYMQLYACSFFELQMFITQQYSLTKYTETLLNRL